MLLYAIIATLFVSLISLVGILVFSKNFKSTPWMRRLIGLAIGTLLGAVFFDLLPEAMEAFEEPHRASLIILASIIAFFVIEKAVHYHHCMCEDKEKGHRKTHLIVNNLIGDGLHNFVDGTIIAGAFLVDPRLGIGTTVAVALHEIPQEVADFSILVYAGLSRAKAILYNVLFGLTSVLGAVLV
ncbi:MAG: ZIP family metal transporter, partial [Patescibacteria group bacterium]|nr:ZIP family metal transporter [Patescibacteria group bacterium]